MGDAGVVRAGRRRKVTVMAASDEAGSLPGRLYPPPAKPESIWPPQATVLAAIGLQLLLPERVTAGPTWLLPALEGALLVAFAVATPQQLEHEHHLRREFALGLTSQLLSVQQTPPRSSSSAASSWDTG